MFKVDLKIIDLKKIITHCNYINKIAKLVLQIDQVLVN